jgi:hypothetical protein
MINQENQYADGHAEPPTEASSADQLMSSRPIESVAVETPRLMRPEQTAVLPVPGVVRMVDTRALQAHVERRRKLAARIKVENPSSTDEEIEARLEQFGA